MTDSFNARVSTVATVGLVGVVRKRANIALSGNVEAQVVADPIILIDPRATFFEGGVERRYLDEFAIAYSPTITQFVPEPSAATLLAAGPLLLARRRRGTRRPTPAPPVPHCSPMPTLRSSGTATSARPS